MFTVNLENFMFDISGLFLTPVLVLITLGFFYAFFQLGMFGAEAFNRKKYSNSLEKGYLITQYHRDNQIVDVDSLELFAFKKIETAAIVTRVAPLLGLVATMITMGPALKSLADGSVQGISENLMIAFSAIILALISASITSLITSKRKGWYAQEIINITKNNQQEQVKNETT